nr:MAG TPA: FeoB-associated Cys-rich membrane protein [Bacteriophage sp.]
MLSNSEILSNFVIIYLILLIVFYLLFKVLFTKKGKKL